MGAGKLSNETGALAGRLCRCATSKAVTTSTRCPTCPPVPRSPIISRRALRPGVSICNVVRNAGGSATRVSTRLPATRHAVSKSGQRPAEWRRAKSQAGKLSLQTPSRIPLVPCQWISLISKVRSQLSEMPPTIRTISKMPSIPRLRWPVSGGFPSDYRADRTPGGRSSRDDCGPLLKLLGIP